MPHVDFRQIKTEDFGPVPVGEYPCIVQVEWIKKDATGAVMTDLNGQPARITTHAGDEMWNLTNIVLDGPSFDKKIYDRISFGEKALKRTKVVLVRAGMMPSDEECSKDPKLWELQNQDFQPEELDGTCWWVNVDKHEAAVNNDGTPRLSKAGKPIFNAAVAFDGYRPMDPKDAAKFKAAYAARKGNAAEAPSIASESTSAGAVPF